MCATENPTDNDNSSLDTSSHNNALQDSTSHSDPQNPTNSNPSNSTPTNSHDARIPAPQGVIDQTPVWDLAGSSYSKYRTLSAILPGLSSALGHSVATATQTDPQTCQSALAIPRVSSAVVILVDGLGYFNLKAKREHAPFLASLLGDDSSFAEQDKTHSLRTCYPSTTTAALATFGTGTCPGLTGMLGYTQLNPRTHRITQMIKFKGAIPPADLQREPTVFERLSAQSVRVSNVSLPEFKGTPMTEACLRGADFVAENKLDKQAQKVVELASQPGLTYWYLREVDKAGHHYGWFSREWAQALEQVDNLIHTVANSLPKGTFLCVSADHGMVETDLTRQIDIAKNPALQDGVQLVAGEPRALMLYTKKSASVDAVVQRWRQEVGKVATVMSKQEAIDSRLYGYSTPRIEEMLGDVLVYCHEDVTIVDSRFQKQPAMQMPGVHGSMTRLEATIPWLTMLAE